MQLTRPNGGLVADPDVGQREDEIVTKDDTNNETDEPLGTMSEDLQRTFQSVGQAAKISSAFQNPFKDLEMSLAKSLALYDPLKGIRQSLKATEQLAKISLSFQNPLKEVQDTWKKHLDFNDPVKDLRQSIRAFQLDTQAQAVIDALADKKWVANYDNVDSDFTINSDGSLSIASQPITQTELQLVADEIVGRLLTDTRDHLESIFQKLAAEIRLVADPIKSVALKYFVFPLSWAFY
jgi:hypothetical protein